MVGSSSNDMNFALAMYSSEGESLTNHTREVLHSNSHLNLVWLNQVRVLLG
jgi:hypothetical protein